MLNSFEQRFELARRAFRESRYADAVAMLNGLCGEFPDRMSPVIESARALSRMYDYAGVQARFAKLEAHANVPCDYWTAMAQISRWLRRPEWAKRYYSNALSKSQPTAKACALFAVFMERSHDLDQAEELVDRGMKIDPSDPHCQLAKAKVLRRRKSFHAARETLRGLATGRPCQKQDGGIADLCRCFSAGAFARHREVEALRTLAWRGDADSATAD